MTYLCVDKSGEYIADNEPTRAWFEWVGWTDVYGESCTLISLPKGTIKKLIGREMTWEDEPFELPLNMFTNDEHPDTEDLEVVMAYTFRGLGWLAENIDADMGTTRERALGCIETLQFLCNDVIMELRNKKIHNK